MLASYIAPTDAHCPKLLIAQHSNNDIDIAVVSAPDRHGNTGATAHIRVSYETFVRLVKTSFNSIDEQESSAA